MAQLFLAYCGLGFFCGLTGFGSVLGWAIGEGVYSLYARTSPALRRG